MLLLLEEGGLLNGTGENMLGEEHEFEEAANLTFPIIPLDDETDSWRGSYVDIYNCWGT